MEKQATLLPCLDQIISLTYRLDTIRSLPIRGKSVKQSGYQKTKNP